MRRVSNKTAAKGVIKKSAPVPLPTDMRVEESTGLLVRAINNLEDKLDNLPTPIVEAPNVNIPEPVIHIQQPEARRPTPYRFTIYRDADGRMSEIDVIPLEA